MLKRLPNLRWAIPATCSSFSLLLLPCRCFCCLHSCDLSVDPHCSFLLSLGWEYSHLFTSLVSGSCRGRNRVVGLPEPHLVFIVLPGTWGRESERPRSGVFCPEFVLRRRRGCCSSKGEWLFQSYLCESWSSLFWKPQTIWSQLTDCWFLLCFSTSRHQDSSVIHPQSQWKLPLLRDCRNMGNAYVTGYTRKIR